MKTIKTKSFFAVMLLIIIAVSILSGCTGTNYAESNTETGLSDDTALASQEVISSIDDYQDVLDINDELETSVIIFKGDDIIAEEGVEVDDNVAYITETGSYLISGISDEGRIIVGLEGEGYVNLILDGLDLTSSEGSPIVILEAKTTTITLAEGTENIITDKSTYIDPDTDTDAGTAAIYSKDDLYIHGSGKLSVYSGQKSGIQSKDQLVIIDGEITVDAAKEAIKAKDYIVVEDGVLSLVSGEDGMAATEEEDSEKGFIIINGGTIDISSDQDGIQAETYIIINDGKINIATTGKSDSSKGIKAANYVEINDGDITIDSVDDCVHSNNNMVINGGNIILSSDDDGMHADGTLTINDGTIDIQKCYEGIEGTDVIVKGGTIDIVASEDGINGAGGNDDATMGGRHDNFRGSSGSITINGGTITIEAATSGNGDGLDSNGDLTISGGDIVVIMPSSYRDYSSIDYDQGTFSLTGGRVRILNTDGTYTEITESNAGGMMGGPGGGRPMGR